MPRAAPSGGPRVTMTRPPPMCARVCGVFWVSCVRTSREAGTCKPPPEKETTTRNSKREDTKYCCEKLALQEREGGGEREREREREGAGAGTAGGGSTSQKIEWVRVGEGFLGHRWFVLPITIS